MSQESVDLVQRLHTAFEDADLAAIFRTGWTAMSAAVSPVFVADFECVFVRSDVGRASYAGLDGLRDAWLDWLSPWASYRTEIEGFIDAGDGRVLVLTRDFARREGMEAEVYFEGAPVWTVRDGKVARIEFYWSREEGKRAAGLEP